MKTAHDPLLIPQVQAALTELHQQQTADAVALDRWSMHQYIDTWRNWISSSPYNSVQGLDAFTVRAYCSGAMGGIESFVHRHAVRRRLRFSQAEFVGARIVSNHCGAQWQYLEQGKIEKSDAVIISLPFSGNGSWFPNLESILTQCDALAVPVLLDMAYFAISHGISVDVDRPCITDVIFSASKALSVPLRLGIRFARRDYDDMLQVSSDLRIVNRWAIDLGRGLMERFSHQWIIDLTKPIQQQICDDLMLEPTATVTLALTTDPTFERNGYQRACITDEIHQRF